VQGFGDEIPTSRAEWVAVPVMLDINIREML
jgi:hypothetical protein